MSNAHFEPRFSIPDEETRKVFPLPEIPWEKIVGRLETIALEIKSFDARLEVSGWHRQVVGEGYADPGLRLDQATVTRPVISVQAWNARARARR